MRLDAGILSLAPSDLSRHLGCAHATTLALRRRAESASGPHARRRVRALIFDKGEAHERDYLEQLVARGLAVTEIERRAATPIWRRARAAPWRPARRSIYQATFESAAGAATPTSSSGSSGRRRSARVGYEAVDTKLARNEARPSHVLQLCFYSAGIAAVQGVAPEHMHIELGSGRRESLRLRDFDAYFARAQRSLERFVDAPPATVAVSRARRAQMCGFCDRLRGGVARQATTSRYVAEIRRGADRARSRPRESTTLAALADARSGTPVGRSAPGRSCALREQARLQAATRSNGHDRDASSCRSRRAAGFERLPEPVAARSGDRPRGRSVLARRRAS